MKMIFKQRFFSWLDSYDIYDENGNTIFTVEGKISWGHCLHILDSRGEHVGTVKEKIISFLPKFEIYQGERYLGCIKKEISFLKPKFSVDCNGWSVQGDFWGWDYTIVAPNGHNVATVSKELLHFTDTYTIDVEYSTDALQALMVVLAIDAEKCSSSDN